MLVAHRGGVEVAGRCNVEKWPHWKITHPVILQRWKVIPDHFLTVKIWPGSFSTVWSLFSTLKSHLFFCWGHYIIFNDWRGHFSTNFRLKYDLADHISMGVYLQCYTGLQIGRSGFDSRHILTACKPSDGTEVKGIFRRPSSHVGEGLAH